MLIPNLLLFYVKDPLESALFYEKIFSRKPVASFPTYVAFSFENGFIFLNGSGVVAALPGVFRFGVEALHLGRDFIAALLRDGAGECADNEKKRQQASDACGRKCGKAHPHGL